MSSGIVASIMAGLAVWNFGKGKHGLAAIQTCVTVISLLNALRYLMEMN